MPTQSLDPDAARWPIQLVPESAWRQNLRAILPPAEWERLRARALAEAEGRCMVCGAPSRRLHCHERWHWDDARRLQRLVGLQAVCALCHHIAHIGLAGRLASEGKLDFERVVRHYLRLNGVDRATFQAHHDAAMRRWRERSRHEWTLDLAGEPVDD